MHSKKLTDARRKKETNALEDGTGLNREPFYDGSMTTNTMPASI